MAYLIGCLALLIFSVFVIRKQGVKNPFSKVVGMAVALSILAVISLGQNYTQSLIPKVNDGIGISNIIAYWIIGEGDWSQELFKNMFHASLYISLILIVVYPIILALESRLTRKTA